MKDGFITALGTPIDDTGSLVSRSLSAHVADQIDAGASALLVMGTMGNEAYIRDSAYADVARVAADAAGGKVPVLVGVMDNSVRRVLDRIRQVAGLPIDGVVATTPYYLKCTQPHIRAFFTQIARESAVPLYLYDLPAVTQAKIEPATVIELSKLGNLAGIKSGDLLTCKLVHGSTERPRSFQVMFSGLDLFDVAFAYGLRLNLDGMFACTPHVAARMYRALRTGDIAGGSSELSSIVELRDTFASMGVLKGFTAAMNLLGYEGSFAPDYVEAPTEAERERIGECMKRIGQL